MPAPLPRLFLGQSLPSGAGQGSDEGRPEGGPTSSARVRGLPWDVSMDDSSRWRLA
ncbi:hypothetical protein RB200_18640 [Streptomyces sp. PmtG]